MLRIFDPSKALGPVFLGFLLLSAYSAEKPPTHSITFLLEDKGAFVTVPQGSFMMGSGSGNPDEAPAHRVKISKKFDIGKYEVTQAQWRAVMDDPHAKAGTPDQGQKIDPSRFKGEDLPVENVSWHEVQYFLQALNARDAQYMYRLPTEAEWEYAAAMQTQGGWCASDSAEKTHPVGQKTTNKFGLYDTLGNVMEWVDDWYAADYYAESRATDPRGPSTGSYKVYRGGAWLSDSKQCRREYRGFDLPNNAQDSVGFRLVRTRR